jgi:hypothetical protein
MFSEMAKYAKKEHSQVIWNCLFNAIDTLLRQSNMDGVLSEKLKYLVQLTDVWTDWKQGAFLFDAAQLQKVSAYFSGGTFEFVGLILATGSWGMNLSMLC